MEVRFWAIVVVWVCVFGQVGCDRGSPSGDEDEGAPPAAERSGGDRANENDKEVTDMEMESSAFADGETIPAKYSCEGEGVSPPLSWEGAPEETQSFVVLCADPDAPSGTFKHWSVYDLAPGRTSLEAGMSSEEGDFKEGTNDFGETGYGAPCPPPGDEAHRYQFRVWALDVDKLDVGASPSYDEVERAARNHLLAEGTLTGMYER